MKVELNGIQVKIVWRLNRRLKYGGSHTSVENALKGFPSHLGRDVREAFQGLAKLGLLVLKPTGYGMHVSLNAERIKTIHTICLWYTERISRVDNDHVYEIEIE